jgi:hypothetical protein
MGGHHDHATKILIGLMRPAVYHGRATRRRLSREKPDMKKSQLLIPASLLILLACSAALAQGGGKAEPNRIEFKPGTNTATLSGTVRGEEEAEYVLAAKKGQRLIIKLTSTPVKSSVFQLLGEDNDTLGLEYDANFDYSGVPPKTGDYFISVKRPTAAKGTSRYKLTVTVR